MTSTRATRKPIRGIPGYEISADGIPRKWGRRIAIHKGTGDLPVIDVNGVELFLDEVVAHAFFGPPPTNIRGMTVVHFDGDQFNCAVTNLAWRVCAEWAEFQNEREHKRHMRPDHLPVVTPRIPPGGMRPTKQRTFFF
jgi:hypothetical protein